jgi:hypothetical protein
LWKKVLWNIKAKVKVVENVRICTFKVIEKRLASDEEDDNNHQHQEVEKRHQKTSLQTCALLLLPISRKNCL